MRKNTTRAIFEVAIALICLLSYAVPASTQVKDEREKDEVVEVPSGADIGDRSTSVRDNEVRDRNQSARFKEIWSPASNKTIHPPYFDYKGGVNRTVVEEIIEDAYGLPDKNGVCKSVYVIDNLRTIDDRLRGCKIVEGNVIINLIENSPAEAWAQHSFPELTEITHYLKFYRVLHLSSLGSLFPNLKIIRGEQLFGNAALVIHECKHLLTIGLHSLTNILHGSVVIQKNQRLCFVESIDWTRIMGLNNASSSLYEIAIGQNKRSHWCQELEDVQCQGCPGKHCWSEGRCQIQVTNCHPLCAAGCSEPNNPDACEKCKGFLNLEGKCVESCPDGTYEYHNRRCLIREECLAKSIFIRYEGRFHYWTFNKSCLISCPSGYITNQSTGTCVRCRTEKECDNECEAPMRMSDGGNRYFHISTIYDAEKLSGCTTVNGSLIITNLNTMANTTLDDELEKRLGMIKNITGILKVTDSHSLTSLNFLRSLKFLNGHLKDPTASAGAWWSGNPESIVVRNNKNLRKLWDWDRPEAAGGVTIQKKSMYFVNNPMLCMSEIEELANKNHITIFRSTKVTPGSNGDQAFCDQRPFNMTVEKRTPHSVVLAMNSVAVPSNYMVYYRKSLPTDSDVRAIRRSLKECAPGDCEWKVTEDADLSPGNGTHRFYLQSLQPAVEYIYIVRSLDDRAVVTSKVYNVSTLPAQPSPPVDLRAKDSTDSSVSLSWSPPSHPRGKIAYYIVRGYYQTDQLANLVERNYCKDKFKNDPWSETEKPDTAPSSTPGSEHPETTTLATLLDATLKPVARSKRNSETNKTTNSVSKPTRTLETTPDQKPELSPTVEKQSTVPNSIAPENATTNSQLSTLTTDDGAPGFINEFEDRSQDPSDPDYIEGIIPGGVLMKSLEKDVIEMREERLKLGPGPCVDCSWFAPNLREPKNMTESRIKGQTETKAKMCNEYEVSGRLSSLKMEPGMEHCDAYIHSLLETKSQMVIAAREGLKAEQTARSQHGTHLVEKTKKGSDDRYVQFSFLVDAQTNSTTINDLRHYSLYVVQVSACPPPDAGVPCSRESIITIRTKANVHADRLDPDSVHVDTVERKTRISWAEPISVNSFILTYILAYRNTDVRNTKFEETCIAAKDFREMNRTYTLPKLSGGRYELRLQAVSYYREGAFTTLFFTIPELPAERPSIATILAVVVVLTVLGLCLILMYLRYLKSKRVLYAAVNPKYELVQFEDHWEVPRENLTLVRQLGRGIFGLVHEGVLQPNDVRCAVKASSSNSEGDNMNFLQEAAIMKEFSKAFHIVKLMGVVSKESPVYVIMELMELGDLKTYLLRSGAQLCDETRTLPDLIVLKMAAQIADGMCFLEAKKFVHRDLAARNCMVAGDRTIKIGDFGLARDVYATDYYRRGDKATLPIRWMAPESIRDGRFTSTSDMWSYGVVLWEITTLAQMPYHPKNNEEVIKYVQTGGSLDIPENTNDVLKPLMRHCWQWHPWQRPRFAQVMRILDSYVDTAFRKLSYYHNGEDPSDGKEVPLFRRELADDCYIYSDDNDEINLYLGQSPSVSECTVKYTRFFPTYHSD